MPGDFSVKPDILIPYIKKKWIKDQQPALSLILEQTVEHVTDCSSQIRNILDRRDFNNHYFAALGFEEFCVNIVKHGINSGQTDPINFFLWIENQKAIFSLIDQGVVFNPAHNRAKSPKRLLENSSLTGYGMFLYKRIFTSIDYFSTEFGNLSILYFNDRKKF